MTSKLERVIDAIRVLPDDVQNAFADKLAVELQMNSTTALSADQWAIIDGRMGKPIEFADRADVEKVLTKY